MRQSLPWWNRICSLNSIRVLATAFSCPGVFCCEIERLLDILESIVQACAGNEEAAASLLFEMSGGF